MRKVTSLQIALSNLKTNVDENCLIGLDKMNYMLVLIPCKSYFVVFSVWSCVNMSEGLTLEEPEFEI